MSFRRIKKTTLGDQLYPAKDKGNQKIKSATKEVKYGLTFDSRLELYMYEQLKDADIRFKFKPVFILQEGFRYRGEAVLPITLTSDFELLDYDIIIDPKGFANDTAPLKNKMLKHYLISQGRQPRIIFPSSQVKCREIIYQIKNGFFLNPHDPKQKLSEAQLKQRIKEAKKHFGFDGEHFFTEFTYDDPLFSVNDIKVLEKWDFHLLIEKHRSKPL